MSTRTGQTTSAHTNSTKHDHTDRDTAVGVFHTHHEAQKAVRELKAAGYSDSDIGIASQDREGAYKDQSEGNRAGSGAAVGAATGLGTGALWGLGIVAGALPAIGPVIAGGALAAVAASAAGTAAAGGLIGALVGLGIPEKEAHYYEDEFKNGRTIVTVKAGTSKYNDARRILDDSNAYDYDRRESDFARDASSSHRLDYTGNRVARSNIPADRQVR